MIYEIIYVCVDVKKNLMPNLNVGSIYLGDHDQDWFIVMSKLGDQLSMRANVSSIIGYYVRRRKSEYIEMLNYTAAKNGLSPQETFTRLLKGIPLGDKLTTPIELVEVPELDDKVPEAVNIEVPVKTYEILAKRAEQDGTTVSDLIKNRFEI